MNIDKKIQEKLNERKWYHRVTALTLVVSLLCAFFVPLDLVMPGMALSKSELSADNMLKGSIAASVDVISEVTGTDSSGENDKYSVSFNLSYIVPPEKVQSLLNQDGNNYVWFEIDNDIQFDGTSTGPITLDGQVVGNYEIDASASPTIAKITFDKDYLTSLGANALNGYFEFNAWIEQSKDNSSDRKVNIAEQEVVIPIFREKHPADLNVEKSYNNDYFTGETDKATYNVRISSNNGIDDVPVYIVDTLSSNTVEFDLTENQTVNLVDDNGNTITGVVESITGGGDSQTAKIRIDIISAGTTAWAYTWTSPVKKRSDTEATKLTANNKAEVTNNKQNDIDWNSDLDVNLLMDITKSGTWSIENGKEKITWAVTINNQSGTGWEKVTVDDLMNGVAPNVSNISVDSNSTGSVSYEGGVFTLNGVSGKSFTFTYETTEEDNYPVAKGESWDGTTQKNEVVLKRDGEEIERKPKDVTISKATVSSKSGEYQRDESGTTNGKIKWTITIDNPNKQNLAGYSVVDAPIY